MSTCLLLAVSLALPQAEFAKYHERITGRPPTEGALTLSVNPSVSKTGKDAYAIVSCGEGADISGSNVRSVWYGIYDLLERRGGCHWFWDGDVVPHRDSIDFSGLDVHEEARFEFRGIRYFAHRGLTRFQAEHWGPEEWKREIDWCLKRRLNVFMLRIGQDDIFQRAFPDVVPYPEASKDLPGHGRGYDNRTLFWSLQYRGKLRQDIQRYAFERGMEIPEDFGTMTHWYSRTPEEFLEKNDPPFLPQATSGYKERNGLVWDIRDDKWVDEYWKLTKTAVREYGKPGLLHTIGLGERMCYTNRADNLKLKILALKKFLERAHADYPDSRVLLAGWDFYLTWQPQEVRELVKMLDPKRDIIWDYEADAVRYTKDVLNTFAEWDVVGRFPYTFSIFLAYENALDMRANYPLIEERQRIVQNDPFCAGYILWPESSHSDTLLLRYFTANAWSSENVPSSAILDEFCRSRYGKDCREWKRVWKMSIPISRLFGWEFGIWRDNYVRRIIAHSNAAHYNKPGFWEGRRFPAELAYAPEIFRSLAAFDWKNTEFTERDAIDLARMVADRAIMFAFDDMMRAYHEWKRGTGPGSIAVTKTTAVAEMAALMAGILALHTDYSLAESFDRLNAIEPVTNPNFKNVLLENATCYYCASHHAESAEHWYKPAIVEFTDDIRSRIERGDRSNLPAPPGFDACRDAHMGGKTLDSMRPKTPRTQEEYVRVMTAFAAAVEVFAMP